MKFFSSIEFASASGVRAYSTQWVVSQITLFLFCFLAVRNHLSNFRGRVEKAELYSPNNHVLILGQIVYSLHQARPGYSGAARLAQQKPQKCRHFWSNKFTNFNATGCFLI